MPSYQLPSRRDLNEQSASATELVPPFIQLDTEGRVIRLDTFSKTISPGSRLGHFTASPVFIERLLRATEVTTQAPSGWSQAITLELLKTWTQEGYLTWLRNLKETYTTRRNWMVCHGRTIPSSIADHRLYLLVRCYSSAVRASDGRSPRGWFDCVGHDGERQQDTSVQLRTTGCWDVCLAEVPFGTK